jgi:hypothetical protein
MEQQSEMRTKLIDVLKKQKKKVHHIALDFILLNGNIHLKSFRLFEFNEKENVIKGMTMQEEYSYLRENREPVYAYFNLNEIKSLDVSVSNYLFLRESIHGAYAI